MWLMETYNWESASNFGRDIWSRGVFVMTPLRHLGILFCLEVSRARRPINVERLRAPSPHRNSTSSIELFLGYSQAERDKKLEDDRRQELQRKIKEAQRREKQKEEDAKRREKASRVGNPHDYMLQSEAQGCSLVVLCKDLQYAYLSGSSHYSIPSTR